MNDFSADVGEIGREIRPGTCIAGKALGNQSPHGDLLDIHLSLSMYRMQVYVECRRTCTDKIWRSGPFRMAWVTPDIIWLCLCDALQIAERIATLLFRAFKSNHFEPECLHRLVYLPSGKSIFGPPELFIRAPGVGLLFSVTLF